MSEMTEPPLSVGNRVTVQELTKAEYKRPPLYAIGANGTVDSVRGTYERPAETTESRLYSVRFESDEIWGEDAESNASVYVDLWQECLDLSIDAEDARSAAADQTND
jgi:hypothetical protein